MIAATVAAESLIPSFDVTDACNILRLASRLSLNKAATTKFEFQPKLRFPRKPQEEISSTSSAKSSLVKRRMEKEVREVDALEKRLSILRQALIVQEHEERLLRQRLDDTKRRSQKSLETAASRIVELRGELGGIRSSLKKQSSKRGIVRSNSWEVMTSLKQSLSDVPDDREEMEAESVWEVNTKISMIRNMGHNLHDDECFIATNRHMMSRAHGDCIARCNTLGSKSEESLALLEEMLRNFAEHQSCGMSKTSLSSKVSEYRWGECPQTDKSMMKALQERRHALSLLHDSKQKQVRELTKAIARSSRRRCAAPVGAGRMVDAPTKH